MEPPAPNAGEGRVGHVICNAIGSVQGPRYRAVGATEATVRTLQRYRGGVTEARTSLHTPTGGCVRLAARFRGTVFARAARCTPCRAHAHTHMHALRSGAPQSRAQSSPQ